MCTKQVSKTALVVAQSVAGLGCDPEFAHLLPAGAAEATERLLGVLGLRPGWTRALARSPIARRLGYRLGNRIGAHPAAFGLRKRFIDDEVRAAIAGGAEQVLVVGAGYDTLAMRLAPLHPELTVVEIDHPSTHRVKRTGVAALGGVPSNLHLLGVDLGKVPLPQALAGLPAWRWTRTSVVVAESCLFYLRPADVTAFLTGVHSTTGADSRLVFTWLRGRDGQVAWGRGGRLLGAALALTGEPWQWLEPDETALAGLLARHGFAYLDDPTRYDLCARYVEPAGIDHRGWAWAPERMAIAERLVTSSGLARGDARPSLASTRSPSARPRPSPWR